MTPLISKPRRNPRKGAKIGAKKPSQGRTCTICSHPKRDEFDKALALKTRSASDIARELNLAPSSVTRHAQNHLLPVLQELIKDDDELGAVSVLAEIKTLYRRMKSQLERAERSDNWQAIRAFNAEARQSLELLAKLIGELNEAPQINILMMQEWQDIRGALLTALGPFPAAREAVADALEALAEGEGG